MGNVTKNLVIVLGLCTVAFAGYYVFSQQTNGTSSFVANTAVLENMLANSRLFIERRQQLEQVSLDLTFFEDERFRSLQSSYQPVEEDQIGRSDPFATVITN